jgi:hypothetical protein
LKAPKAPPAPASPDPVKTAQAQGGSNIATATVGQTMSMVDQYTPDGNLVYEKIGETNVSDGMGGTYNAPRYKATQTLSPEQEALRKLGNETETNIGTIARDQSARIGTLLGKPVDINNETTEARLYDLGSKRLDPRFAAEEESTRTRLINSGVREGSDAWKRAMTSFTEGKNDAYNQLLLTGRGQAVQEILTARNQPINEITALLSGSQVSQPQFTNTPQAQVAGVDYAGIAQNDYSNRYNAGMDAYKQKMGTHNAMMGGLFGLAGNAAQAGVKYGMATPSDRRLKRDIETIGEGAHGLTLYRYRYLWSDAVEVGYMADEVARVRPDAVVTMPSGFLAVDYAKLGG